MLFNSIHFLIYLPIVTVLYFALPFRIRGFLLLGASLYFYGVYSIPLSSLMIGSTVLDYYMAQFIEDTPDRRKKKMFLACSVVGNLGTLAVFKYANFFNDSLAMVLGEHPWPVLHLALPMGISFYTFECLSYTIDVYRGEYKARRSLIELGQFVTFFPHLVAGPIMRAKDFIPQFSEVHQPNLERMLSGALRCVWGLLKKLFIADPMGRLAATVFGSDIDPVSAANFSGWACLLATYAFALQIYCDFSAYSDIAIGAGRILGFRLMENFDSPYLALSIRDFWRRWHISLSTWLRDYLYVPMGGNKRGALRTYINLMATMLLGGLWHGAAWTFVIWGGLHGAFLAFERWTGIDRAEPKQMGMGEKILRWVITFHLVCLAWIFFRAVSAAHAWEMITRIFTLAKGESISAEPAALILLLVAAQMGKRHFDVMAAVLRRPAVSRWAVYLCLALLVRIMSSGTSPEFIYFQF